MPSDLCLLNQLGCPPEEVAGVPADVEVIGRRRRLDADTVGRLHAICRSRGANIVHAHDGASQFIGALLRVRRPGVKLLMTFHRSLGFESARVRDRIRNALVGRLTAAVVVPSRERQRHYVGQNYVPAGKVVRIPMGIDLARFPRERHERDCVRAELGVERDTIVLGAVGHFGPEKGLDIVFRGLRALCARKVDSSVALLVMGDGKPSDRQRLHDLAASIRPARVILMGFQPRVERWLQACDLFVHMPRQEAFGLAVVEAMASALPIVASKVGGLTDIVQPMVNGWLVRPDSQEDLVEALEALICNPRLRRAMAGKSREIAEAEYGAERYARRYLRLYHDILAGRRCRDADEPDRESADTPHGHLARRFSAVTAGNRAHATGELAW